MWQIILLLRRMKCVVLNYSSMSYRKENNKILVAEFINIHFTNMSIMHSFLGSPSSFKIYNINNERKLNYGFWLVYSKKCGIKKKSESEWKSTHSQKFKKKKIIYNALIMQSYYEIYKCRFKWIMPIKTPLDCTDAP